MTIDTLEVTIPVDWSLRKQVAAAGRDVYEWIRELERTTQRNKMDRIAFRLNDSRIQDGLIILDYEATIDVGVKGEKRL